MNDDRFLEWHKFLNTIREGFAKGELKSNIELTDFDIAIQYVIRIAYEHNYKILTDEMICHLLKAFTDVEEMKENE